METTCVVCTAVLVKTMTITLYQSVSPLKVVHLKVCVCVVCVCVCVCVFVCVCVYVPPRTSISRGSLPVLADTDTADW